MAVVNYRACCTGNAKRLVVLPVRLLALLAAIARLLVAVTFSSTCLMFKIYEFKKA